MENIYAALLLHKLGNEVNEENIKKVLVAAGAEMNDEKESQIKSLAVSLKDLDIEQELVNASLPVASGPAGASETESAESEKADEKEEEKKDEEAAADGLSSLFG